MDHKELEIIRFFSYIDKTETCWLWTASTQRKGYGQFKNSIIPGSAAHRLSFFLAKGFLPENLCVLHRCDNPPCVNPDHLFLGTIKDNSDDKIAKGRYRNGALLGSKNPKSKITEVIALEIRNSNVPARFFMDKYNLSKAAISHIRSSRRWGHV